VDPAYFVKLSRNKRNLVGIYCNEIKHLEQGNKLSLMTRILKIVKVPEIIYGKEIEKKQKTEDIYENE